MVNERASLAGEIGRIKNNQGSEVFSPAREEEVLKNVIEANKGPLDEGTIRALFREIISGSRALQKILGSDVVVEDSTTTNGQRGTAVREGRPPHDSKPEG